MRRGKEKKEKRNKDKQSLSGTGARIVLLEMHLHQSGNKESVSLDDILAYFNVLIVSFHFTRTGVQYIEVFC